MISRVSESACGEVLEKIFTPTSLQWSLQILDNSLWWRFVVLTTEQGTRTRELTYGGWRTPRRSGGHAWTDRKRGHRCRRL